MTITGELRVKINGALRQLREQGREDEIPGFVEKVRVKYGDQEEPETTLAPVVSPNEAPSPSFQAPSPSPVKQAGIGGIFTQDIPQAISGAWGRTKARVQRIEAPTEAGVNIEKITGTEGPVANVAKIVARTPERFGRTVLGAVGTLGEVPAVASEIALKSINRFSDGKFGEMFGKIVNKVASADVVQDAFSTAVKWWESLPSEDKANLGSLPDVLDAIGLGKADEPLKLAGKAVKKKVGESVTLAGKEIKVPRGPTGVQRVVGSAPGGRGQREKFAKEIRGGILEEVESIKGPRTFEETAESFARGATQKIESTQKEFNDAFGKILDAGKKGVRGTTGLDADAWAKTLRRSVNAENEVFNTTKRGAKVSKIPTGLSENTMSKMKQIVDKINDLDKVSTAKKYQVFRDEKSQFGNFAFGPDSRKLSGTDKKAARDLYKKIVKLERDFIADQSAFFKADRDKVLELFDATNSYYGKTKPIRDFTKKLIGYNIDAGEKGSTTASKALSKILEPGRHGEAVKLMELLDPPAKEHLRKGLMIKIIDKALIEDKEFISVSKLQKQMDNIGRNQLTEIVGLDNVERLDNLIKGIKKSGAQTVKLADPTNKSGTAAANIEKLFFGGTALGTIFSPPVAVAAVGGAYVNRLVGSIIFNQPLSAIERGIGRGIKGVAGAPIDFVKASTRTFKPGSIGRGVARGITGTNEFEEELGKSKITFPGKL